MYRRVYFIMIFWLPQNLMLQLLVRHIDITDACSVVFDVSDSNEHLNNFFQKYPCSQLINDLVAWHLQSSQDAFKIEIFFLVSVVFDFSRVIDQIALQKSEVGKWLMLIQRLKILLGHLGCEFIMLFLILFKLIIQLFHVFMFSFI